MTDESARPRRHPPSFAQLLEDAVNKPGVISAAYAAFHNYSIGNQLIALFECYARKIEPGPINTFRGWLKLARHVRKGEKAIALCMPIGLRSPERRVDHAVESVNESPPHAATERKESGSLRCMFVLRPHWFVLSQTDGDPFPPVVVPAWEESRALQELMIDKIPFDAMNGNVQGFARGRSVSVSPIAYLPHRTLLHEIAHVVLGHTQESIGLIDNDESTPKDIREVEAEAVAYICCQSLGLAGEEFSRGYLQHWLGMKKIDERSARKIFAAAEAIHKAGRPPTVPAESE